MTTIFGGASSSSESSSEEEGQEEEVMQKIETGMPHCKNTNFVKRILAFLNLYVNLVV